MRLLLTAFRPFNGEIINPTMKVMEALSSTRDFQKLILPVTYAQAFPTLQQALQSENFTDILMMGQAAGRSKVCLERVALNWRDSGVADEAGIQILESKIIEGAPPAYFTSYPLRKWFDQATKKNLPLEISNTAGAFICNSLSYELAHELQIKKSKTRWLFLHVPYLPEQVIDKPSGTPSMELEQMIECVQFVIQKISEERLGR